MELKCALVLLVVGFATASPYGYGTKGAGAKADASAVASAYTGGGAIPASIPSGAGYSGSFSKSYSSSSASSSASSSSSSFSYSGSGVDGGANGCGSGNCNGGGVIGSQGSAAAGSQAHSSANAGSTGGYGSKPQTGSYGHKYNDDNSQDNKPKDCGPEGCPGTNDSIISESDAGIAPPSTSGVKVSADSGNLNRPECIGADCNNLSGANNKCSTAECGSDKKCTPQNCGAVSSVGSSSSQYGSTEKCASGQCVSNQDGDGGSSLIDYGTNDIRAKTSGSPNLKSSYGAPGGHMVPSYNKPATHLTVPVLDTPCSGINCENGQYYSPTDKKNPACNGGYCGYSQTKAPFASTGFENVEQSPSSNSEALNNKPNYSHGSSPSHTPSLTACAPGNPACGTAPFASAPSDCASGSCGPNPSAPGYGGHSSTKPSYSFPLSPTVIPSSPGCIPGTPGCASLPSALSGCVSGNCGQYPSSPGYGGSSSLKPSNTHISSSSYSPENSFAQSCTPGTPGCSITPSISGPTDCASGNCGSNIKPYSHGSSSSYFTGKPSGLGCAPGSIGCLSAPSASSPFDCKSGNCNTYPPSPSYGGYSSTKPTYSHGSSPLYTSGKPSGSSCEPGTPGCGLTPSLISSSNCASGNCGANPSASSSSNIKPGYSHAPLPSYSAGKPLGLSCQPGTPGCATVPSVISFTNCATGNCGAYPTSPGLGSSSIKPSYSSLSHSPNPSDPGCASGTIGCASVPSPSGSYATITGYGGSNTNKPSYTDSSSPSYSQFKPAVAACTPGTPGCTTSTSSYYPTGCVSGNCGTYPTSQGCAPGSRGCSAAPSTTLSEPSRFPSFVPGSDMLSHDLTSSPMPISSAGAGIPASSYGASGVGSSFNQGSYGSHGSGSYNKPSSVFPTGSSGSGAYTPGLPSSSSAVPEIGSPTYTSNAGATTGSNAQQDAKEGVPYTGGFGGPSGILKPNEFKAPISSYGNKPAVLSDPISTKPACTSGICEHAAPVSPSHADSGSATGAQASAGASASANAIAYTGGFGGPPGYLKPYDNGKVDLKAQIGNQHPGSSLGFLGTGSGIHSSYTNGGSHVSGSAVSQANAAAVSNAGVSDGSGKLRGDSSGAHDNGHDSASGCGGGCGGNSGSNHGYSGSHGLSKTGVMDDSNNGLATAGAVAKSVASASSGARSYGGSFSSSSASAHATSGASVKGGYGRR